MRFQKVEQVPCEDTELVLRVLEDRLQTITRDVVREGGRITLFGLGPSPRAINPRDTTVIDVKASDGGTTIDADVSYQASAFLGDAPQDAIVASKLERVFEELRAELDLKARREQAKTALLPAKIVPMGVATEMPDGAGRSLAEASAVAWGEPQAPAVAIQEQDAEALRSETEVPAVEEEPSSVEDKRSGRFVRVIAVACLFAVGTLGVFYLPVMYRSTELQLPLPAAPAVPPAEVTAPPPPEVGASDDPAEMVREWGLAIQSRDAVAQASFYADPVERYFLRRNVGRDAVQADRQSAIDRRKDGWTVTMDHVKVSRKVDSFAYVGLVKHYIVQREGKRVSEWFVPSRLQLKREDGTWHIVSERDLGWAATMAELDAR